MVLERCVVLDDIGLQHIKDHKYKAGAYTPLDNLINPLWARLTLCLPLWLAPNLVTFSGFVPLVIVYALYWGYCPKYDEDSPGWLLCLSSFVVIFYQTMDAMDGKQARRTQSSSPLGQLVDHGCDCVGVLSHHCQVLALLVPGPSLVMFSSIVVAQVVFFAAQWMEYHTGVLNTAAGPVGVTEGQLLLSIALLVAGIAEFANPGSRRDVMTTEIGMGLKTSDAVLLVLIAIHVVALVLIISLTLLGAKSWCKALLQWLPIVVHSALMFAWSRDLNQDMPRSAVYMHGLLMSLYTNKMIIASMAKQQYEVVQWSIIPYACVAALSHVIPLEQMRVVVIIAAAMATLYFIIWHVRVSRQVANALGINVLTIKKLSSTSSAKEVCKTHYAPDDIVVSVPPVAEKRPEDLAMSVGTDSKELSRHRPEDLAGSELNTDKELPGMVF